MKAIDAVLEINASQQEVWDLLADFGGYHLWNPYIKSVKGQLELEKPLDITFRMDGKERRIRGRITVLYPPSELRFEAKLGPFGMFVMEHTFHIEQFGDRQVCFVQRQAFEGMLATEGRIKGMADQTRAAFEAMNKALKERVEAGVSSRVSMI